MNRVAGRAKGARRAYPSDDLLDALLVALHFEECLDLADGQVFSVTESDELIKGAEQLVCILDDFALVEGLACASDDLGKQVQGVDVLEDVGLAVGNEDHVELVEGLVYETDIVLLNGGMLGAAVGKLGERSQQSLYARSWHLPELSGEDSFPSSGANRSREDDLGRVSRGDGRR